MLPWIRADAANAWTDAKGALHLRIAPSPEGWTCAEVILTQSLGYGTYSFVVRDISQLPPAVVMGLFTWDDLAGDQRFREMDVEFSRWGDPGNASTQYVVQPYYVPAIRSRITEMPMTSRPMTLTRAGPGALAARVGRVLGSSTLGEIERWQSGAASH